MRTVVLVLLGAVVVVALAEPRGSAAPVPKHLLKEPDSDKGKLQGKWKVESMKLGDKDVLNKNQFVVEFRGDTFVVEGLIGNTILKTKAILKHDASGAKRFIITESHYEDPDGKPVEGGSLKDEVYAYTFDEGRLLLATNFAGTAKPAPDPLKPGPHATVIVHTRIK